MDAAKLVEELGAVEHRMFGGRIEPGRLGVIEGWIAARLGVTDRDDRDWKAIDSWAETIASRLSNGNKR